MHVLVALAKGLGCLDVNTLKSEIQHLKAPKTCFLHQLFRWQVIGETFLYLCFVYLLSHWFEEDGAQLSKKEKKKWSGCSLALPLIYIASCHFIMTNP